MMDSVASLDDTSVRAMDDGVNHMDIVDEEVPDPRDSLFLITGRHCGEDCKGGTTSSRDLCFLFIPVDDVGRECHAYGSCTWALCPGKGISHRFTRISRLLE
jgi:hypothetical protein